LLKNLLGAGYLEDWKYGATLSGTPQGGIVSPILANIYLDRLDQYVERTLVPAHTRGTERTKIPLYSQLKATAHRRAKAGRVDEAKTLWKQIKAMPSRDPNDPDYRRLRYTRYADDFLLGFCGPRHEAEEIKRQLREFLRDDLKLELSEAKTLVTHARTNAARFLGYEVTVFQNDQRRDATGQRSINGTVGLRVPMDVILDKCRPYMRRGKPVHRMERVNDSEFSIVAQHQMEYRGLAQYYQLALNRHRLNRLKWVMETSLTKTLARKLRISVKKVYDRFGAILQTEHGPRKGLRVTVERGDGKAPLVAEWGGVSLARQKSASLDDQPPRVWNRHTELEQRLLADECELCGSRYLVEVHHVRALSDLRRKGRAEPPEWVKLMASRHRKTLVVCKTCHEDIHHGRPTRQRVVA
jgi:hypothetical protein